MKRYTALFVLFSVTSLHTSDDGYDVKKRLEKVSIGSKLKEAIDNGDNKAAKHILKQADEIPKGTLHYSIAHNQDTLAKFMLKRGVPVNQKAKGLYPLMVAIASKSTLVSTLLKQGTDIHHIDAKNGNTALHYACTVQEQEGKTYFDTLVKRGASTYARNRKGTTTLHLAVGFGNEGIVTTLIDKKMCDINAQDNEGYTPLMYARAYNHKQITLALIKAGAKIDVVNNEGDTVLHMKANLFAKRLIDSDDEPDMGKRDDDIAVVKELLAICPNIAKIQNKNGKTPLHIAVADDRADLIPVLAPYVDINATDNEGATPLIYAIGDEYQRARQELVNALLAADADLNTVNGWRGTPLQVACRKRDLKLLRQLLMLGADANHADSYQSTPLKEAITRGQADFVKELIPHCNLEQLNSSKETPLWQVMHVTECEHSQEIAVMLINARVNVHGVDIGGRSLLFPAVRRNWIDVIKLLLEKGLDPLAMDIDGDTVFGLYELRPEKCSAEMTKLLLQAAFNKGPNPLNDDNLKHYGALFSALAKKAKLVLQYNEVQKAQAKGKEEASN